MTPRHTTIPLAALLALGAALPHAAWAESLASSASSAGSASSGSVSDSIKGSSNSSTAPAKVAAGDYRIEAVSEAPDRPGLLQVALQAVAREGQNSAFVLVLPRAVFEAQGLARGDSVSARERPYGLEFARADTRIAFFLVLADDWTRELDPRPVRL